MLACKTMTLDQQIQLWNTIGTWLAGIATFVAVVVSLRLASRADRVRLKIHAGVRLQFMGDGSPPTELIEIHVTNLAERPVTIQTVGWAIGEGKTKRFCIQSVCGPYTAQYPKEIAHGNSASFQVAIDIAPTWFDNFVTGFVNSSPDSLNLKTLNWFDNYEMESVHSKSNLLNTLVAVVHTSVGQNIETKAESNLIEKLRQVQNVLQQA
ncbi:MAG: hypothetical protein WCB36_08075 [Burkholderiales bacterium]